MAAHTPSVLWACAVCPRREQRMPSQAKSKCCYGCRGAYQRRFGSLATRRGVENRIRRVMFRCGLTERDARLYLQAWREGYQAGRQADLRRRTRLKVGSAAWERSA